MCKCRHDSVQCALSASGVCERFTVVVWKQLLSNIVFASKAVLVTSIYKEWWCQLTAQQSAVAIALCLRSTVTRDCGVASLLVMVTIIQSQWFGVYYSLM